MESRKINFDQKITIVFFSIQDDHLIEATWIEQLILSDYDFNRALFTNAQIWKLIII